VERAKKCLDFTATLYFLHLLFCCVFRGAAALLRPPPCLAPSLTRSACAGWPRSFEWWLLNITGMILMAVLGCVGLA